MLDGVEVEVEARQTGRWGLRELSPHPLLDTAIAVVLLAIAGALLL